MMNRNRSRVVWNAAPG
ncbi:hypothetical protein D1156_16220 [Neglecta sp. X58]|nr:hypothetical protein [Neglectibacter sp. X58]